MADELAIRVKLLYDEGAAPGTAAPGGVSKAKGMDQRLRSIREARYWSHYSSEAKTEEFYGKVIDKYVKSGIKFGGAAAIGAGLGALGAAGDSSSALSRIGGASLAGLFASGGNPVAGLVTGIVATVAELRRSQTDQAEKIEQGRRILLQVQEDAVNFRKEQEARAAELQRRVNEAIEKANENFKSDVDEIVYQTRLAQVR